MSNRALALISAVLVVGSLAAGCGKDEGSGSAAADDAAATTQGPITKAEFVKQANAICADATATLREEVKDRGAADLVPITLNALRTDVDGISALGAPPGDEAQVEVILDNTRTTIAKAEAGKKGLTEANKTLAKATQLAEKYGLKSCMLF